MTSKTLSFSDEKPSVQAGRMAVELRMEGEAQLPALLPPSVVTPRDPRFRTLQTELWESENYQVALVPPAKPADRFRVDSPDPAPAILLLPLTWRELIAMVHAEEDHARSVPHSVVRFGNVRVDLLRWEVSRSDVSVVLTPLEFKLLRFFVTCPGRVISRDELLNQVWGFENYPSTRTVDNHILRLRKKLEPDPTCPIHFQTVHGLGYKFVLESSGSATKQRM
jgi:DNA-binding winged helix-turn-helix (wHTH) protein